MAQCDCCGNDYNATFTVEMGGERHRFDSFECAIHTLAPHCGHCGCRVLGHGVQTGERLYCCAHCARHAGDSGPVDHA